MTYQGSSIIDYFLSTTDLNSPELIIKDDLSLDSIFLESKHYWSAPTAEKAFMAFEEISEP